MRKRQAYDLEDAHQGLCEEEKVVEYRKCLVRFSVPSGLIFCLILIDLDISSRLVGVKATATEASRGLMWGPGQMSCAYYCKGNESGQVEPCAERYEDGVEEAGGEHVAVEVGGGALSQVSEAFGLKAPVCVRSLLVGWYKASY